MYINIDRVVKNATAGEEKSSTLRHESTSKQIFSYIENLKMAVKHFKYPKTHLFLTDQKMPITQVCKIRAHEFSLYFVICNLGVMKNAGKRKERLLYLLSDCVIVTSDTGPVQQGNGSHERAHQIRFLVPMYRTSLSRFHGRWLVNSLTFID